MFDTIIPIIKIAAISLTAIMTVFFFRIRRIPGTHKGLPFLIFGTVTELIVFLVLEYLQSESFAYSISLLFYYFIQSFAILSIYIGIRLYLDGSIKKQLLIYSVFFISTIQILTFLMNNPLLGITVHSLIMSYLLVSTGYFIIGQGKKHLQVSYKIIGFNIVLWGLHSLDAPFFMFLPSIQKYYSTALFIAVILAGISISSLGIIVVNSLVERIITADKKAAGLSLRDELTGLYKSRYLREVFPKYSAGADRHDYKMAILFIDLIFFEPGDDILKAASKRMNKISRNEDILIRQDGDGFILLLSEISDRDNVKFVINRIEEAINKPFHLSGNEIKIENHIGYAMYPEDGKSLKELVTKSRRGI